MENFNQDFAAMPMQTKFNVLVFKSAQPKERVFVHTANSANTNGHITTVDHYFTNGMPKAILIVTQNWGSNGPYNSHHFGVWYSNGKWTIFNQDFARMPDGAKFNVLVMDEGFASGFQSLQAKSFVHRAVANPNSHISFIEDNFISGDPSAILLVTPNWGASGPYNPHAIGVWYSGKWSIYNQDRQTMPGNAMFNVLAIRKGAPPSSFRVALQKASFYLPGEGVRNNNSYIGDFCCTGETATVYAATGNVLGYIYFYDFDGAYILNAYQSAAATFGVLVSGISNLSDASSSRVKSTITFRAQELINGASRSVYAGALKFTVTILEANRINNGTHYIMGSVKVRVDVYL